MRFLHLDYLLIILPLLLLVLWRARQGRRYFSHPWVFYLRDQLPRAPRLLRLPAILQGIALAALIAAVLQPVLFTAQHTVVSEGLDVMLVLDLSSSMQEPMDLEGALKRERLGIVQKEKTRLEAVREAMSRFVHSRRGDRIGLVVFSEEGYVVVPMTTDIPYMARYLQRVDTTTLASEGQTAIGEGIFTALEHVARRGRAPASGGLVSGSGGKAGGGPGGGAMGGPKGKVMIVLTDGENNAGRDAVEAIDAARGAGFRVHFIGVEVEKAKDAPRLMAAVAASSGRYYDVRQETQLLQAYYDIDRLEKGAYVASHRQYDAPFYFPFALLAFAALLLSLALRTRRYFLELS